MLRLLAEHEGYRYYLLLVDDLGAVTEWLPGPEHFSLFIYQNEDLAGHKTAQMDQLAQSAILAGAECVWCGGLMGSELDDIFDNEFLALQLGLDDVKTKDMFPEDYFIDTLFDVYSDFDEQVWQFMNITDSELRDRIAVFQKDDLTWKRYKKSLKAWINGDLQLGEYSEETDDLGIEGGYSMTNYGKVATLENEVEAQVLSSMLDAEGIDYAIRTYHDSAYNGLFQMRNGWGIVEADLEDRDAILEILQNLRAGNSPLPDDTGTPQP
ncbi:MAG TPA: hypothetical protein PLA90_11420 [Candidatus Sumerlaeota bacterium]|nr:hypothetical protein [Candidatus Sumerlaeota bacterium]HPS02142.1 hypothetical protein [Candidatus Sumerlaeota bacterium]